MSTDLLAFGGIGAEMSDDPPAQPPRPIETLCRSLVTRGPTGWMCPFPREFNRPRMASVCVCRLSAPSTLPPSFCVKSRTHQQQQQPIGQQTQAATVARLVVAFMAVVCPSPALLIVCCCCVSEQTPGRLFLCQIDSTFVWLS